MSQLTASQVYNQTFASLGGNAKVSDEREERLRLECLQLVRGGTTLQHSDADVLVRHADVLFKFVRYGQLPSSAPIQGLTLEGA